MPYQTKSIKYSRNPKTAGSDHYLRKAEADNFRTIPEVALSDTYMPPREEPSNYYANELRNSDYNEIVYEEIARELSRLQRYDRRFETYQSDYGKR